MHGEMCCIVLFEQLVCVGFVPIGGAKKHVSVGLKAAQPRSGDYVTVSTIQHKDQVK